MLTQKKVMKFAVAFILIIFLLSSGLVSVMYFVDMKKNVAQTDSGEVVTGTVDAASDVEVLPSNLLQGINVSSTGTTSTGGSL